MIPDESLSAKLDKLFDAFHPLGEPEDSPQLVAHNVSSALGVDIPAQMIDDLRRGRYNGPVDPTLLTAIADHFQVPGDYLTKDGEIADSIDQQLELLAALRELGVQSLEYRGGQLELPQVRAILAQLPNPEPNSGDATAS